MDWYQHLVRPLLFRLTAEQAHTVARRAMRVSWPLRVLGAGGEDDPRLRVDLAGIQLSNPVGLAPGFDKDGRLLASLESLGFGYAVVGSVTEQARPGNPRPRLVRYPHRLSLANAMGLPNEGAQVTAAGLAAHRPRRMAALVSVAGPSAESIVAAARIVAPWAVGLEVGLVCPNSSETERMAELAMLDDLLAGLMTQVRVPVFVKLPPHRGDDERRHVFRMLDACIQGGIAGVSLSGSRRVAEPGLGVGAGSLSGRETFADAYRIVSDVAAQAGGRLVIRASGGVWSGDDALAMMRAGASTVEVYTAFIYQGWRTAGSIKSRLVELLDRSGRASLPELVAGG